MLTLSKQTAHEVTIVQDLNQAPAEHKARHLRHSARNDLSGLEGRNAGESKGTQNGNWGYIVV